MTIDLSTLEVKQGEVMHLAHPADETQLLGPTITLAGIDSEVYRRTQSKLARVRVEQIARNRKRANDSDDDLELLVACTQAWTDIKIDGKLRDCTDQNKRELYTRFPWIRDQAAAFMMDREKYFRGAAGAANGEGAASAAA